MPRLTFYLLIFIIITGSFLMFSSCLNAQEIENPLRVENFSGLISRFTSYLLGLAAPLAILVSLWAAVILMTAAGQPDKIQQGRKTLTYAVIGLAVIILSHATLNITQTVVGAGRLEGTGGIIDTLNRYLRNIGGPLAIVMFLYGSLLFSSGQPAAVQKAYKIFLWTSVAIAIIAVASSIGVIVNFFLK